MHGFTSVFDGLICGKHLGKSSLKRTFGAFNGKSFGKINLISSFDLTPILVKPSFVNLLGNPILAIALMIVESQLNSLPNFQIKSLFQAHCFYYSLVLIKKSPTIFAGQDTFN